MHTLSTFELTYSAIWLGVCAVNLVLAVRNLTSFRTELKAYVQLLWVPWKLITFVPAFVFLCLAGPYTNDPTWDTVTGGGMAILTYFCAPWSIGVIMSSIENNRWLWRRLGFAIFLLLFSSSWFYDGYLLLRDGFYPPRWWSNLLISSTIFIVAGLFWNLEVEQGQDYSRRLFSFQRSDWPHASPQSYAWPPLRFLLPPMAAAVFLITGFVVWL